MENIQAWIFIGFAFIIGATIGFEFGKHFMADLTEKLLDIRNKAN